MIGGLCSALFGGALAFAPSPATGLVLLAGLQFFSSFPIAPSARSSRSSRRRPCARGFRRC
jgi:hypothetical protein